jgi:hypothetical protein
MSGLNSSTLDASTNNLLESDSTVRNTKYTDTSLSRAESHADGVIQESSTITHTETYGNATSNAIATSKTSELANQSPASRNPSIIITSYNEDSSTSPFLETNVQNPSRSSSRDYLNHTYSDWADSRKRRSLFITENLNGFKLFSSRMY